MKIEALLDAIGSDFYTGVPDSKLIALCDCLMDRYGVDKNHHIIAANEGNAVGIAAGYHLATGKVPVVYMQNSGEGNVINPVASLLNEKVYAIPMVFIIGWRGEPGVHDEPQHVFQGEITLKLLDVMDIKYAVLDESVSDNDLSAIMDGFRKELNKGHQVAFVIKKNAITYENKVKYKNDYSLVREEVIERIASATGEDMIISSTGKISRELFDIREKNGSGHGHDFLTVGSMGHSSSIAVGVALAKPEKTVWCIDGDGAVLMHMGSLAVNGALAPSNLIHVVINNGAHETVGGMPTVAGNVDFIKIATACGYVKAVSVDSVNGFDEVLSDIKGHGSALEGPVFIEIKCAMGSRADLGRPTTTPIENKNAFMAEVIK